MRNIKLSGRALVVQITEREIRSIRMTRGAGRKLAFGPYLAAGIWVAALVGDRLIGAYLGLFGL